MLKGFDFMTNNMMSFSTVHIGATFVFPTWDETSSIWIKMSPEKAVDMDLDSVATCAPKKTQAVIPVKTDILDNVENGGRFWVDHTPYMKIADENPLIDYGMNLYTGEVIEFNSDEFVILNYLDTDC